MKKVNNLLLAAVLTTTMSAAVIPNTIPVFASESKVVSQTQTQQSEEEKLTQAVAEAQKKVDEKNAIVQEKEIALQEAQQKQEENQSALQATVDQNAASLNATIDAKVNESLSLEQEIQNEINQVTSQETSNESNDSTRTTNEERLNALQNQLVSQQGITQTYVSYQSVLANVINNGSSADISSVQDGDIVSQLQSLASIVDQLHGKKVFFQSNNAVSEYDTALAMLKDAQTAASAAKEELDQAVNNLNTYLSNKNIVKAKEANVTTNQKTQTSDQKSTTDKKSEASQESKKSNKSDDKKQTSNQNTIRTSTVQTGVSSKLHFTSTAAFFALIGITLVNFKRHMDDE